MTVYPTETQVTTGGEPYMLRKAIVAIKEAVPVERVANDLGADLKPSGEVFRGKGVCHGGSNETALLVDPEQQRWRCFRCNEGGDVIDLCARVENLETWAAVVSLAVRYGIGLPRRSETWHRAQDDKARVRDAAVRAVANVYQRRLTRLYAPLVLVGGETAEEERREVEELAHSLWPISYGMAHRAVCGDG